MHRIILKCLLFRNDEASRQEFEVIKVDDIYQYAQSSSFSLLTFTIPANAQKVQFQVSLTDRSADEVNRTIVLWVSVLNIPVDALKPPSSNGKKTTESQVLEL